MHTHTYIHTCMHASILSLCGLRKEIDQGGGSCRMYRCMHTRAHVYTRVFLYTYMYLYLSLSVNMCVLTRLSLCGLREKVGQGGGVLLLHFEGASFAVTLRLCFHLQPQRMLQIMLQIVCVKHLMSHECACQFPAAATHTHVICNIIRVALSLFLLCTCSHSHTRITSTSTRIHT